jgi:hypothetical protein
MNRSAPVTSPTAVPELEPGLGPVLGVLDVADRLDSDAPPRERLPNNWAWASAAAIATTARTAAAMIGGVFMDTSPSRVAMPDAPHIISESALEEQRKPPSASVPVMRNPDELFAALAKSKFRSRIHLRPRDAAYLRDKGMAAVLEHARRFIRERLAPADPLHDGKQTPMHGHPAFVSQHATATCCRGCLAKWHFIEKGRPLTDDEIEHVIRVIERWIRSESAGEDAPLPLFPDLD